MCRAPAGPPPVRRAVEVVCTCVIFSFISTPVAPARNARPPTRTAQHSSWIQVFPLCISTPATLPAASVLHQFCSPLKLFSCVCFLTSPPSPGPRHRSPPVKDTFQDVLKCVYWLIFEIMRIYVLFLFLKFLHHNVITGSPWEHERGLITDWGYLEHERALLTRCRVSGAWKKRDRSLEGLCNKGGTWSYIKTSSGQPCLGPDFIPFELT